MITYTAIIRAVDEVLEQGDKLKKHWIVARSNANAYFVEHALSKECPAKLAIAYREGFASAFGRSMYSSFMGTSWAPSLSHMDLFVVSTGVIGWQ